MPRFTETLLYGYALSVEGPEEGDAGVAGYLAFRDDPEDANDIVRFPLTDDARRLLGLVLLELPLDTDIEALRGQEAAPHEAVADADKEAVTEAFEREFAELDAAADAAPKDGHDGRCHRCGTRDMGACPTLPGPAGIAQADPDVVAEWAEKGCKRAANAIGVARAVAPLTEGPEAQA